jgi:hypothetical protein
VDLLYIQELDKEEGVEQRFVEGQEATQKDIGKGEILEVGVQPQKEVQLNRMEISMTTPGAIDARRKVTILDRTTLLNKGIHIPDVDRFMWI